MSDTGPSFFARTSSAVPSPPWRGAYAFSRAGALVKSCDLYLIGRGPVNYRVNELQCPRQRAAHAPPASA
jgi:hypothetical protein